MTHEEIEMINGDATNQIYLLQIDSENDITDIRFRANPEIETTYATETGKIVVAGGFKWFTLLRDNHGGFIKSIDFDLLFELKLEYGDKFLQYKQLPKDEMEEM